MINGDYILVIAPDNFPYKKYRGKYCYEHVLVYWKHYGHIPTGYIVHHVNGDKHDNRIENLKIMSNSEHVRLHNIEKGKTMVVIKCPYCKNIFTREKRNTFLSKRENTVTLCSRSCSGKFSHMEYTHDEKIKIGENSILRIYNSLE